MNAILDGWASAAAKQMIVWLEGRVDPSYMEWTAALAAECDNLDGGWRRLRWAMSGLPLAWAYRRPPAPRVAGIWSTSVDPRLVLVSVYRSRVDIVAFVTTLSLMCLVAVFIIFVMPVFEAMLASADLTMPLAARVVLKVCSYPAFSYVLLLAPLLLLYRARKVGSDAPIRRALPVVNVICVVALIGLTSGIVGFLVNARPIFRAAATNSGWSPPATTTPRVLPAPSMPR